jgi:hypothetical protein
MNNFKIGIIPYSWNFKNATVDWAQCEEEKHVAPGWENIDIKYRFNAQGFRTYDLERLYGQRISIALGCSCTEGIGVPEDKIWSALVEKSLDHPVLNLGIQGGSGDTVVRILTNVCSLYDIRNVYILWPESSRFEVYYTKDNTPHSLTAHRISRNKMYNELWATDLAMSNQRFYKNQLLVQCLSKIYNFTLKEHMLGYPIAGGQLIDHDSARDGLHPGPKQHQLIARNFINEQ